MQKYFSLKSIILGSCFGALFCSLYSCKAQKMDHKATRTYIEGRTPDYPVDPLIVNRTSSYIFSDKEVTDEQLMTLFEAARWAPSSYNNQSWRFVYAKRNSPSWQTFLDLLVPFNQEWANKASALVVIISKNTYDFNGQPSRTHSFDAGAAWENLAIQAVSMGLVTHGMEGFDYDETARALNVPGGYTVEAIAAIGYEGDKNRLPEEMKKSSTPSTRKPVAELAFEGSFKS